MGNVSGKSYVPEDGAEIDLRQFEFLRNIGKGAFGKVRIVQKRDTQKMYALKYINKKKCVRMDAVENILRERRILEELKHPFVVNLWFAFQDDVNIYMVLDLMLGGDLRFHFERIKYFPEEAIRFYAAEIGCALSYLHSKGIVHRDLKPDNLLLDDDGHIHITDFNIARKIEEGKVLRSHSGTLCYMAPEIFMDQGYTFSVDWWSLGIILFELTFGRTPFAGENHQGVQNDIVNAPLTFPSRHIIQKTHINPALECIDIIRRLLERNVPSRLSCGPSGIRDFCSHPWFDDLDWVALENLELKPPFSPKSGEINFDPIYDLEEILLEEDPLEYRPWKPKRLTETDSRKGIKAFQKSKSAADVQLEYLEQQFQTFDISIYDKYKGTEATPPGWVRCVDGQPKGTEGDRHGSSNESLGPSPADTANLSKNPVLAAGSARPFVSAALLETSEPANPMMPPSRSLSDENGLSKAITNLVSLSERTSRASETPSDPRQTRQHVAPRGPEVSTGPMPS